MKTEGSLLTQYKSRDFTNGPGWEIQSCDLLVSLNKNNTLLTIDRPCKKNSKQDRNFLMARSHFSVV